MMILVLEDNPQSRQMMEDTLREGGYEAVSTDSAAVAKRLFDNQPIDIAILDVEVNDGNGYDVCDHIRAHATRSATPVVMLTAKSSQQDKERGFSTGADQYLTKPIEVRELMLWLGSLRKRTTKDWSGAAAVRAGNLTVNPAAHTVGIGGREIRDLTPKEFALLWELVRVRPSAVSREDLLQRVWGEVLATNTLEVHVMSLRRKLGAEGAVHISTVKGVGYRFE